MSRWMPVLFVLVLSGACQAGIFGTSFIANGFDKPVYVTAPGSDSTRLWVVEQGDMNSGIANVRIIDLTTNTVLPQPFLSVNGVMAFDQDGLLGMAFDPDYANNRYSYVAYVNGNRELRVDRFTTLPGNPNVAAPASQTPIITIPLTPGQTIHAGGWLGFSPIDNMLYVAVGDAGPQNDTFNVAQNVNTQMGKMLRIDPHIDNFPLDPLNNYGIPGGNPNLIGGNMDLGIWATGLRHPWRNSFDRLTGDFWIADVGQDAREEINFQPGGGPGGQNYGWRNYEGTLLINGPPLLDPNLVFPVYEYDATMAVTSIVGGYVNRAPNLNHPLLNDLYLFTDVYTPVFYGYDLATNMAFNLSALMDPGDPGLSLALVTSFGEDADGRIYVTDYITGSVYRLVPEPSTYALLGIATLTGIAALRSRRHRFAKASA